MPRVLGWQKIGMLIRSLDRRLSFSPLSVATCCKKINPLNRGKMIKYGIIGRESIEKRVYDLCGDCYVFDFVDWNDIKEERKLPNLKLIWKNDNPKKPKMPSGPYNFIDFWVPFIVFFILSGFCLLFSYDSLFGLTLISWFYFYNRGIKYVKRENFKEEE